MTAGVGENVTMMHHFTEHKSFDSILRNAVFRTKKNWMGVGVHIDFWSVAEPILCNLNKMCADRGAKLLQKRYVSLSKTTTHIAYISFIAVIRSNKSSKGVSKS